MLTSDKLNGMTMKEQLQAQLKALEEKEKSGTIIDMRDSQKVSEEKVKNEDLSFQWPEKFTQAQRIIIGEEIARLRKQIPGMTQTKLERLCNFGDTHISQIELGKKVIDKAMLKRIGFHLNNDFNQIVKEVCGSPELFKKESKKEAIIALGDRLIEDEERVFRIRSQDFELKCMLSNHQYTLWMVVEGIEQLIYDGKRSKDCLFIHALEKIIKMVKKDV